MIEYRYKSSRNSLYVINRYTPHNKEFRIDEYTGESWIKVTYFEHTPEFTARVKMLCEMFECEDTLTIIDCSQKKMNLEDTLPSLF